MKIIKFEIVTPERVVFKENITQIILPTKEGEITVLPNHIPLIASLQPGVVEIKKKNGAVDVLSVSGGFVEVFRNKIVILADTAEMVEEIDEKRAEEARRQAEEAMKSEHRMDQERFTSLNTKIAKELARTRAVKRWKKIKSL